MSLSQQIRELWEGVAPLGIHVQRPGLATDLAAIATVNIFQVVGGDVLLVNNYGKVTTIIGNVGATTLQLNHTPTGGAAAVLCTASGGIATNAVNTIYSITGAVGVAMAISAGLGVGVNQLTNALVLVPGIMGLVVGTSGNTGVIEWNMYYVPLEPNARMIAL